MNSPSNVDKVNVSPEMMDMDDVLNILRNELNEGSTLVVVNTDGVADQAYRSYKLGKVLKVNL